jgi:hypothetical protein
LKAGDYARVEADERSGEMTITRVPIEPRANYDIREVGLRVIEEERELLYLVAANDSGEEA